MSKRNPVPVRAAAAFAAAFAAAVVAVPLGGCKSENSGPPSEDEMSKFKGHKPSADQFKQMEQARAAAMKGAPTGATGPGAVGSGPSAEQAEAIRRARAAAPK